MCNPLIFCFGSGGRIRTSDLRVMSPTSYLTAPPRDKRKNITPNFFIVNEISKGNGKNRIKIRRSMHLGQV